MFRALPDIWDGTFSRIIIGFELWTVFVKSVQRCVQSLLEHLRWSFLQMLRWVLSMSQAAGRCKISTATTNSRT